MKTIDFLLFHSNNPCFNTFSNQHIGILLTVIILIFMMYRNQDLLRDEKFNLFIRVGLLTMLITQQVLNYLWYYTNGELSIIDALPLYPCRISELLSIVILIRWNNKIADVLFFVGLSGATLALILPDTSGLGFPNAMFIQFFLGHIGIMLTIVFKSISEKYIPDKHSLIRCYKYTTLYVLLVMLVNKFLDSNYAYLKTPPPSIIKILPCFPYFIPILVGFMFLTFALLYIPCYTINKKKK